MQVALQELEQAPSSSKASTGAVDSKASTTGAEAMTGAGATSSARAMPASAAATPATSIVVVSQGQGYILATCPMEIERLRRQFEMRTLLVPDVEDEGIPGEVGGGVMLVLVT